MAQQLIVEGNDAIVLSVLCQKAGLNPPLGYEKPAKFKQEFVKTGNGYTGALDTLTMALKDSSLTNIGIILDADDAGYPARWSAIRNILKDHFSESALIDADSQTGSKLIEEENMPVVGVWIMPDNNSVGYLEHFLAQLIPQHDALFTHAKSTVASLQRQPFNELTPAKIGKAELHTWLSWKRDPGKPFGQAMTSGYFDMTAAVIADFINWFKGTFRLS